MRRYVGLRWSPKSFLHHQSFTATARIAPAPFCQKRNQPSMTHRDGEKREWLSEGSMAIFFSQTSTFALKLGKRIRQ